MVIACHLLLWECTGWIRVWKLVLGCMCGATSTIHGMNGLAVCCCAQGDLEARATMHTSVLILAVLGFLSMQAFAEVRTAGVVLRVPTP